MSATKYLIPSFQRCGEVTTLDMLEGYGVSSDEIFIGVQTKQDLNDYQIRYKGRCNIVYSPTATNAAGNRNGLLEAVSEPSVVLLDDDLRRIAHVEPSVSRNGNDTVKFVPLTPDQFRSLVEGLKTSDADIAGVSHVANGIYLRGSLLRKPIMRNQLVEGSFMVLNNQELRFDTSIEFSEDFELCYRVIANGGGSLRNMRYVIVKSGDNGKKLGGCHELYKMGKEALHAAQKRQIVDKYAGIAAFTNNKKDCISLKVVNV